MVDVADNSLEVKEDANRFVDLVMQLTLVVLLAKTLILSPFWPLLLLTELTCFVGIMFPEFRKRPELWFSLAGVLGFTVITHWEIADNHRYLFFYWSLALGMVTTLPISQQRSGLRTSAAIMIGLCMGFATYWKVVSVDYLDDSFFQYTLLTDGRFDFFTRGLTQIPKDVLIENRRLEDLVINGYRQDVNIPLVRLGTVHSIDLLAKLMTWWTVGIEGALAIAFLLPGTKSISFLRNFSMLAFAVTTYAVATVVGFAWVLLLMGLAQCRDDEVRFQRAYLVAFLLVIAYHEIPVGLIMERLGTI